MPKKIKNIDFIQQFLSSASAYSAILESITYIKNICKACTRRICCLCSDQSVNNINLLEQHKQPMVLLTQNSRSCLHMWYSPKRWHRGDELLNKVIIFVFFVHEKYTRSFVKLRLKHWCHIDYFNDLLATFLSLDHVRILAVNGRVWKLSELIKNILICVLNLNEGLTDLQRHEGE